MGRTTTRGHLALFAIGALKANARLRMAIPFESGCFELCLVTYFPSFITPTRRQVYLLIIVITELIPQNFQNFKNRSNATYSSGLNLPGDPFVNLIDRSLASFHSLTKVCYETVDCRHTSTNCSHSFASPLTAVSTAYKLCL